MILRQSLRTALLALGLALLRGALIAQASPVLITDRRCVSASLPEVIGYVTNYSRYATSSGASLAMNLKLVNVPLLKMTKSQEVPREAGRHSDSIVFIELRPLNLTDHFPHFFIRCTVAETSARSARHECHSLTAQDLAAYGRPGDVPAPFGLADFQSTLDIEDNSTACAPNQSLLSYRLSLEPNSADVAAIRGASGLPELPLPEEKFFRVYYENFFRGWMQDFEKR